MKNRLTKNGARACTHCAENDRRLPLRWAFIVVVGGVVGALVGIGFSVPAGIAAAITVMGFLHKVLA
ncbi:hypothetical protein Q5530_19905 [Saccharothrix sp. BKS2]|uniref:hypothetical protein n=1 Tax=Saccharothrix sp. BKS2 TaxID=3064400 RepID=UPI0039E895B0